MDDHGQGEGRRRDRLILPRAAPTWRCPFRFDLTQPIDLTSPFGVAWHNGRLYVAPADAIQSYPYERGQTEINAEPTLLTPLPGGRINHHWTKDLALSPCYRLDSIHRPGRHWSSLTAD